MRAQVLVCVVLVGAGCGSVANNPDAGDDAVADGPIGGADASADGAPAFDVTHVGPADEATLGTADLVVMAGIDTSGLTIGGATSADFVSVQQDGGGPDLALLRVRSLQIPAGATVTVRGLRPLVIFAATDIAISGRLDAGGATGQAGPGGDLAPEGQGANGVFQGGMSSPGAGGGGYGHPGGPGGPADGPPGMPGIAWGDPRLPTLIGGASGGRGGDPNCVSNGGGGGGAIQLTAIGQIAIDGVVNTGGGGGQGGAACGIFMAGGGGGGGSGGAIYLQSAMIRGQGQIAAHGGGGGGGASTQPIAVGGSGQNASAASPAMGGNPGAGGGAGRGGTGLDGPGEPGFGAGGSRAGGGGAGGAGRIVWTTIGAPTLIVSPAAVMP
jgi:hypothetical protein